MTNDLRGLPHENSIAKASRAPSQSQVVAALQRVGLLGSSADRIQDCRIEAQAIAWSFPHPVCG